MKVEVYLRISWLVFLAAFSGLGPW